MATRHWMQQTAVVGALVLGGLGSDVLARGGRQSSRGQSSPAFNNGDNRGNVARQPQFNPPGPGNSNWRSPANSYVNRGSPAVNQPFVPYNNFNHRAPYFAPQPAYRPQGVNQAYYNYSNSTQRPATGVVPSNYVAPTPVAKSVPPAPVKTPTVTRPLTVRESAAALLLAHTREAAWDAYENYSDSPGYADTYRELHKFLQSIKSLSQEATRQATSEKVTEAFAAALQEAEINLQVLQVQTESWQRSTAADRPDLQAQLQKMASSLAELMTAARVESQLYAAVDEEPATVIRAKE